MQRGSAESKAIGEDEPVDESPELTTEFWLTALMTAVVIIAGYVSDDLSIERGWTLGIALVAAYVISRGISKAGSSERFVADPRDR